MSAPHSASAPVAPTLPADLVAERAVLGALLAVPSVWGVVSPIVRPSDFFSDAHRVLYATIGEMVASRANPDFVTVPAWLRDTGQLDAAGGVGYVSGLVDELPDVPNAAEYAAIVRQASTRRALMRLGQDAIALAAREVTATQALDEVSDRLAELQARRADGMLVRLGEVAHEELRLLRAEAMGEAPSGLPTGIASLDSKLHGLKAGQLIVIGADTGVGKTSLAMGIALHAAVELGKIVLYVSLEMSAAELAHRALAMHSGVSEWRLLHGRHQGRLDDELGGDWGMAAWSAAELDRAHFHIADGGHVTPGQLRGRCKALQLRSGLDLVVVDYLQLMTTGQRHGNRTEEVSALSRAMKMLARDLGVPVICLSQISRAREQRGAAAGTKPRPEGMPAPDEPRLSDLRESGSIANDADVVLLLHRKTEGNDEETRRALCIVAKARSRGTGRVVLRFDGPTTRYTDGLNTREG